MNDQRQRPTGRRRRSSVPPPPREEEDFHPEATINMPDGPVTVAWWNGQGYECAYCHAVHASAEIAGQHAQTHVVRSP